MLPSSLHIYDAILEINCSIKICHLKIKAPEILCEEGTLSDQNYNNFHLDTMGFLFILARLQLFSYWAVIGMGGGG
jgi:hypothetical protein